MKKLLPRVMALLCALTLCACCAGAESAPDAASEAPAVLALVNGEQLFAEDYRPFELAYLTNYASLGYDMEDEAVTAYIQDLALTAAIEDMLVEQDIRAQGFLNFDEETEAWCAEQGRLAYEAALAQVGEALRTELELGDNEDVSEYALAYAQILGVTDADYTDVYRTQLARAHYYAWLTQDWPVTDEDVQAAFEADTQQEGEEELTEALRDELAYAIYAQRCQERLNARVDLLAESAEVTIY
ncbi:MAG: hypothetical protein ACI4WX_03730 [Aristaeellaceae bacterium]